MIIKIIRDRPTSTEVKIEVTTGLNCDRSILSFSFNTPYEYTAALLKDYLEKTLGDQMEKIRKDNYEQGYNDGKGHKQKKTWFSRLFN